MQPHPLKTTIAKSLPRSVRRVLRDVARARRLATFQRRVVTHDYAGVELRIELSDPVAVEWYDHDWAALEEITLLREGKLRPGATVFDLGAHQAVVALVLAHVVGPEGRVVALEGDDHAAAVGRRNLMRNGELNVTLHHAAVAASDGQLSFGHDGSVSDELSDWRADQGPARSIDSLAAEHGWPDVLFLDVEGYEVEALSGATKTLERFPDAFVEVHSAEALSRFGANVHDVLAFFPRDHYALYAAAPNERATFHPLEPFDPLLEDRFFLVALSK